MCLIILHYYYRNIILSNVNIILCTDCIFLKGGLAINWKASCVWLSGPLRSTGGP